MYVLGVDPGLRGAISLLDWQNNIVDLVDMPVCPKSATKNWVDAGALNTIIKKWLCVYFINDVQCALENVHAMPGQGVSSMFSFGQSLGIVQAVLVCNNIPIYWISPQIWKKYFSLPSEKKAATAKVCNLYPNDTSRFTTPRGRALDGRAEAVLIARYLQEKKS